MKRILVHVFTVALILSLAYSCKKDDDEKISEETLATNKWIYENMNNYYLWTSLMPTNIDYTKESDPEAYFYKLLYNEKDKWSYITDDYASLEAELSGDPVTMGYDPAFYLTGSNKVIIAVKYVYPGSPAAEAGLSRGDIILSINNATLDTSDYYDKYTGTGYSVQLGAISGNTLTYTGESLNMTARVTETDPAIYHQIIDVDGRKIGYLVYVGFLTGENNAFLTKMDNIFSEFKTAGISDLVVDLRYNPGGEIDAAVHLASTIAPVTVTTAASVLVNLQYNDLLQAYLISNNETDFLYYKFESASSNINMDHVYFLTTSGSASASELTITGLEPYMNVVHIGEPTYGKYTGSWVMPDDNNKWAMMPIVMKYANANGYTDFANGLTPDYPIEDDLFSAVPFGDTSDPMLAKAIELATGKSVKSVKAKAAGTEMFRQIVPAKMDLKKNLLINGTRPLSYK